MKAARVWKVIDPHTDRDLESLTDGELLWRVAFYLLIAAVMVGILIDVIR